MIKVGSLIRFNCAFGHRGPYLRMLGTEHFLPFEAKDVGLVIAVIEVGRSMLLAPSDEPMQVFDYMILTNSGICLAYKEYIDTEFIAL